MSGFYKTYDGSTTYHRYFTSLRGLDLASDPSEVSRSHFAYLENMWCDPVTLDGVAIETHPGFRTFGRFGAPILGIFRHRVGGEDYLIVHAGTRLYRFPERLRNHPRTLALLSPLPVTVPAVPGCAFPSGERLCLLLGGTYLAVDATGELHVLGEDESLPYVPVTYYNGTPYEERNLLTSEVRLSFTADGPYEAETGEEGLVFTVFNETDKSCSVRISEKHAGAGCVRVPAAVTIGTERYTVKAIAPRGFADMPGLVSISLPATVTVIGAKAFMGDTALSVLNLPYGVTSIGKEACFGCLSLARLYLGGSALSAVGAGAFDYCRALKEVRFGGTEEELAAVLMEGENTLVDTMGESISCDSEEAFESTGVMLRLPLHEPCLSLSSVLLGDAPLSEEFTEISGSLIRYEATRAGDRVDAVEITLFDRSLLVNKTVTVRASAIPITFTLADGVATVSGKDAVTGCTATVKYDGRIFFTGNERLPNTVFYTAIDGSGRVNPFYVGAFSYFNDGTGAVPNRGFLVSGGVLAVLKADAGGEGEIFFHTAKSTGSDLSPRIYPVTASTPGVGLAGETVAFSDDALFLGKRGLFALTRCATDGERVLSPRSSAVNRMLLREDIATAKMAVYEGMLYLLCHGGVYLADWRSRSAHRGGSSEYEWYYLSGVGSFAGDRPVYRYTDLVSEEAREAGFTPHPSAGEVATGEIYSTTLESGESLYYERTEDASYPVDTDGERTGGTFFPATVLAATDEALYFGTEEGAVGCFNTDKRGKRMYRPLSSVFYIKSETGTYTPLSVAPPLLLSEEMLDTREVYTYVNKTYVLYGEEQVYLDGDLAVLARPIGETEENGRVHRYYYSHDGHAFRAACMLALDDGDVPHFAKETVAHSATVKLKAPEGAGVSVFVRTDRHPFRRCDLLRATHADVGDLDFAALDFHGDAFASLSVRERERGWCYKQYLFESVGHRTPFGLYSLTYSYRPTGRIKP